MSSGDSPGLQPWSVEQSEEVLDCRIFKVRRETARSQGTGKQGEFYVLNSPDWINVIAVTPDQQLVCVSQYRHGSRQLSLETPAGLIEPDETIEQAAARELSEETGYVAREFKVLGSTFANPAFMTNRYTAVLAEDVTPTEQTAWDEHEEIELRLVPVAQIPSLLARGEVQNTFAVLALSWYLLYREGILRPDDGEGSETLSAPPARRSGEVSPDRAR